MVIYSVYEQWPHREIACFLTLEDARAYMVSANRYGTISMPIIVRSTRKS